MALACLIKKNMPKAFDHIARLKDLKDLNITSNMNKASDYGIICPLSQLEHNGINKFIFFLTCGCVISAKALSTNKAKVAVDAHKCPVCGTAYRLEDIVEINQDPEETEQRRLQLKKATKAKAPAEDQMLGVRGA